MAAADVADYLLVVGQEELADHVRRDEQAVVVADVLADAELVEFDVGLDAGEGRLG